MAIGIGTPIYDLANLPGQGKSSGGGGGSTPTVDLINNDYSMKFDRASATYMQTGINIAADSDFSVSFWVKGGTPAGFVNNHAFGIGQGGNPGTAGRLWGNRFIVQSYDNTGANFGNRVIDIDIYDGNWHHLVFTRDSSTGQYFAYTAGANVQWIGIYGASNAPSVVFQTPPSGDLYLGIAESSSAPNPFAFDGSIDEFALFNRVLQEEEIKAIYDSTNDNPGKTANLDTLSTGAPLAWYRMGD